MNWKKRYERKPMDTVNGIPIYENEFYIINDGETRRKQIPVSDGYVVKINKITHSIYFDDRTDSGNGYGWPSPYRAYIVRRATIKEEKKWHKYYKK